MRNMLWTPRQAKRVVDMPEWYGGGYDLVSGTRPQTTGYGRSGWGFACMQVRGTELAQLPWRLTRNGEVVENSPLEAMLRDFGPESNWSNAVIATEINQLMSGEAFWAIDRDRLQRLDPQTMKVNATPFGITGFEQIIRGKVVNRFSREEVVYFRNFNPEGDLTGGPSEFEIAKPYMDLEKSAVEYTAAFFQNDATPSLLLTTEQSVPEAEMGRVKRWWDRIFRGKGKGHKVGFLDKGLKAQILSHDIRSMALVELRDQARRDICTIFRVPMVLVGSMDEATYANAGEARRFLLENVIVPRAQYYADTINEDLVKRIDPTLTFEFAVEDLPLLQEDMTEKWSRLEQALGRGIITPEFARQEMGWPEAAAPGEPGQPVLRSWRRKSLKALAAGRSADVQFETDDVPMEAQAALRARLAVAKTVEDVNRAFA